MKASEILSNGNKSYFVDKGTITNISLTQNDFGTSLVIEVDTGREFPKKVFINFDTNIGENPKKFFPLLKTYLNHGIDLEISETGKLNLEQMEEIKGKDTYVITYRLGEKYKTYNILSPSQEELESLFQKDQYIQNKIKKAKVVDMMEEAPAETFGETEEWD